MDDARYKKKSAHVISTCAEGKEVDSQRILHISEAFRLWIKNNFCFYDFVFGTVIQPKDPFYFCCMKQVSFNCF